MYLIKKYLDNNHWLDLTTLSKDISIIFLKDIIHSIMIVEEWDKHREKTHYTDHFDTEYTYGDGYVNGTGNGAGMGFAYGLGSGEGRGYGAGNGYGSGEGNGWGQGKGFGTYLGRGNGDGTGICINY